MTPLHAYSPMLGINSKSRKNIPIKFWKKVRNPPVRPSATGYEASQDSSKNNGIVALMNIPEITLAAYSEAESRQKITHLCRVDPSTSSLWTSSFPI